jgi:hypothetical protein
VLQRRCALYGLLIYRQGDVAGLFFVIYDFHRNEVVLLPEVEQSRYGHIREPKITVVVYVEALAPIPRSSRLWPTPSCMVRITTRGGGQTSRVDGGELRGRVEDDGEGFEPGGKSNDGEDGGPAAGVGLRSMKERTEMLDGRLEISSKPEGGTAVEVRIPLAH